MLSISKPLAPEQAASYFQRDNYYLEHEGEWYGQLAEDLKLNGAVNREDFLNLLQGFDSNGEKLVASAGAKDVLNEDGSIKKAGHRSGIDLTFSAPKSVSILSYQDARISEAFKTALKATLDNVEKEFAHTQRKVSRGKVVAEKTEGMLWSTFLHNTSRELDPQLHCHCVLMNITKDNEGKYKTLHNDSLYKNKMFLGQIFRSELAQEIKKLGYSIEVTDQKKGFFEIAGVGENIIQAFSKRRDQVTEELASLRALEFKDLKYDDLTRWARERKKEYSAHPDFEQIVRAEADQLSKSTVKVYENYSDAKLASIATTNSRVAKRDVTMEHITSLIDETCRAHNTSLSELHRSAASVTRDSEKVQPLVKDILQDAVKGLTEGQSTFTRHNLLTEALKMGMGLYTTRDFERAFNELQTSKDVQQLGVTVSRSGSTDIYSSREMIQVEHKVIEMCKEAKGASSIGVDGKLTDDYIFHTDINLKMKSSLELGEKDLLKAEKKFQKTLSKIDDESIKQKMREVRELALAAKANPELPKVDAVNYPELHEYFAKHGYGFTPGQKDALKLITSTKDQFSVIQGDAGTGKSFSCLYAKQLVEEHGFIVKGFAPTGKATTGLASSAEISAENYSTIDSFLIRYKNAEPEERNKLFTRGKEIWLVDEAGMCGSKKFLDLMKAAKDAEAKVVFIGDRKQFQSIEAGRMFSELQDKAGIDMVIMPDVMRQRTAQTKEVVKAISLKDMDFAFNVMGGFMKLSDGADKTDLKNYSIGSTLSFSEPVGDIPADVQCRVTEIKDKTLKLEYFDDATRTFKSGTFQPSSTDASLYDVYRPPTDYNPVSRFSLGDQLVLAAPEQGLPATTLKLTEISETTITVSFKDPETDEEKTASFDPTKNPDSIMHLTESGNEKLATSKETYQNMITVEKDKEKCTNLVAQDYLETISYKVGNEFQTDKQYGDIPKGAKVEVVGVSDLSHTLQYLGEDGSAIQAEVNIKDLPPRQEVLLITGTNKDKDALNSIIRPELINKGLITDSKEFTVFQNKSMSGTGAMAADSYKPGQVIVTNNKCGEIGRGVQAEIVSVDKTANLISVRAWDKESNAYKMADIDVRKHCKDFSTYDQLKKEFGVGDLILFLKNDKKAVGVNNGDTARILSIDAEGNVKARLESTDDKKEVTFNINNRGPQAYNYVSHAYAITDYKSQGATTSRLLWYAPTEGGPMSSNTFYVAITRCKDEVGVYTDNVDKLREMVKTEQHKESILDYTLSKPKEASFKLDDSHLPRISIKDQLESAISISPLAKAEKEQQLVTIGKENKKSDINL